MRCPRPSLELPGGALLAMVLAAGSCVTAQGTVLYLRNGDRLSGTIVAEESQHITFKTTWHNIVLIPLAEIRTREETPPPAAVPPSSAPPVTGAPGTVPVTPPVSSAVPAKSPSPHKFGGEAQVGTDLHFSEKNRQLVSGRLKLTYAYDRLHNVLDYLFSYGRTEGVLSDNRMFGSLKSDYDLDRRWFVYNLGGAGYDEIRRIDFRYELGPGLGYHVSKQTNLLINVESGVNYQAQYLADHSRIASFYYRFAEDATWQIHARLSLDERFEYFPQTDNWGKYRLRFESNVRYAILNHVALVLTVLEEYDTRTAIGIGQNDLQIRSSLSMKF